MLLFNSHSPYSPWHKKTAMPYIASQYGTPLVHYERVTSAADASVCRGVSDFGASKSIHHSGATVRDSHPIPPFRFASKLPLLAKTFFSHYYYLIITISPGIVNHLFPIFSRFFQNKNNPPKHTQASLVKERGTTGSGEGIPATDNATLETPLPVAHHPKPPLSKGGEIAVTLAF